MMKHREPVYTSYVRHCMRFYSRYSHPTEFYTPIHEANWQACHRAIQNYSTVDKNILKYVYGERDTLGDNVYNASMRFTVRQDLIWELMREFERRVAEERGLL